MNIPDPADPGGGSHGATPAHAADCPHCHARLGGGSSAKLAWAVAAVAVVLLVAVFVIGIGTRGGNLLAAAGLPLLAILACPLIMGGMMWMMMRGRH